MATFGDGISRRHRRQLQGRQCGRNIEKGQLSPASGLRENISDRVLGHNPIYFSDTSPLVALALLLQCPPQNREHCTVGLAVEALLDGDDCTQVENPNPQAAFEIE